MKIVSVSNFLCKYKKDFGEWDSQNNWFHWLMMSRGMVLRDIVSNIICTWSPVDHELVLIDPVSNPVKSYINCLAPILFHCAIEESNGCFVINFHSSRWLWVAHLWKGHSKKKRFFSILKSSSHLSFHGWAYNRLEDLCYHMKWGIEGMVAFRCLVVMS